MGQAGGEMEGAPPLARHSSSLRPPAQQSPCCTAEHVLHQHKTYTPPTHTEKTHHTDPPAPPKHQYSPVCSLQPSRKHLPILSKPPTPPPPLKCTCGSRSLYSLVRSACVTPSNESTKGQAKS